MKAKRLAKTVVNVTLNNIAKVSANCTTCVVAYQPKVPKELAAYSKLGNDK